MQFLITPNSLIKFIQNHLEENKIVDLNALDYCHFPHLKDISLESGSYFCNEIGTLHLKHKTYPLCASQTSI